MKLFIKLIKYFVCVVALYFLIYTMYALVVISSKIDLYFICIILLGLVTIYWVLIGVYSPKKLPFFKFIKKRIIVLLVGFLVILILCGIFFYVETYIFKRNPLYVAYKNISFLYYAIYYIRPFSIRTP